MPLTIELREARGGVLRRITNQAGLVQALPPVGDPDFPMLGLLDRYGDTFFSPLQMRAVIPEIERLKQLTPNPPEALDELAELAEECAHSVHVFLVFVGD
jgi:hypothetical protein